MATQVKNKKKRWIWIAVVIILVVIGALAWNAVSAGAKAAPLVEGVKVTQEPIAYKIFTRGDVQSKTTYDVVPKVSGRVAQVHVKEGDVVKVGDPLVTLDVEDLKNQLQDLEIELAISKESLAQITGTSKEVVASNTALLKMTYENAKNDYENAKVLFESGSYSQAQVNQAKQAMLNAEQAVLSDKSNDSATKLAGEKKLQAMRIESTELKIERLKQSLANAVVLSPAEGTVSKINVKILDTVSQAQPVMSIQDLKHLEIATNINQYDISKIQIGQEVIVTADGLKDKTYKGTISRISPVAVKTINGQSQETVVPVMIDLDNAQGDFKPNYTAKVEIVIESADQAVTIPYEATKVKKDNERFVYVIVEGKLQERMIETGIESDIAIQVLGDTLKVGDVLVLNPNDSHVDGMEVLYMEEATK